MAVLRQCVHSPSGNSSVPRVPSGCSTSRTPCEPGSRHVGQVELSALCWVPGGAAAPLHWALTATRLSSSVFNLSQQCPLQTPQSTPQALLFDHSSIQQLSLVSWVATWSMPPPQTPSHQHRCSLRPPLCYQHPPAPLHQCLPALRSPLAHPILHHGMPRGAGSSSLLPQHHHPPGMSSGALHDFGNPNSLTSRRKSLFETVKTHLYSHIPFQI